MSVEWHVEFPQCLGREQIRLTHHLICLQLKSANHEQCLWPRQHLIGAEEVSGMTHDTSAPAWACHADVHREHTALREPVDRERRIRQRVFGQQQIREATDTPYRRTDAVEKGLAR